MVLSLEWNGEEYCEVKEAVECFENVAVFMPCGTALTYGNYLLTYLLTYSMEQSPA